MAKEKNEKIIKITLEGKQKMEAELLELRTVKRKEIAEKIKVARSYGDLSENRQTKKQRLKALKQLAAPSPL